MSARNKENISEKDGLTSSLSTEISDSVPLVLADALEINRSIM